MLNALELCWVGFKGMMNGSSMGAWPWFGVLRMQGFRVRDSGR